MGSADWTWQINEVLSEYPAETDVVEIVSLVIDWATTEDTETSEVDRWAGEIHRQIAKMYNVGPDVLTIPPRQ